MNKTYLAQNAVIATEQYIKALRCAQDGMGEPWTTEQVMEKLKSLSLADLQFAQSILQLHVESAEVGETIKQISELTIGTRH